MEPKRVLNPIRSAERVSFILVDGYGHKSLSKSSSCWRLVCCVLIITGLFMICATFYSTSRVSTVMTFPMKPSENLSPAVMQHSPPIVSPTVSPSALCITQNDGKLRIFTIGFQFSGTMAIHSYFRKNRINSYHYSIDDRGTKKKKMSREALSDCMTRNYLHSVDLLSFVDETPCYALFCVEDYEHFSNFGLSSIMNKTDELTSQYMLEHIDAKYHWYYILNEEYPKQFKYILNIRPVYKWLPSRYNLLHPEGILRKVSRYNVNNITQLFTIWVNDWYRYICHCIDYFQSFPEQLLIFDIENDDITKLINFIEMDNTFNVHLSTNGWTSKSSQVHTNRNSHQLYRDTYISNADELEMQHFINNTFDITDDYREINEILWRCQNKMYHQETLVPS